MKLLLTSSGISNARIRQALDALLGKPVAECRALCITTGMYPFPGGAYGAYQFLSGATKSPMCGLGWKALGVLELTALPSIDESAWVPTVREADALLVWGGDPLFLSDWMRRSGLADLMPSLPRELVYVGVSAGSMAVTGTIGETYDDLPKVKSGEGSAVTSDHIVFTSPQGDLPMTFVTARGVGLVDFAVIPHLDNPNHSSASLANAEQWAARLPVPTYAIDDQTAIQVVDGAVEVISEGTWKLFPPRGGSLVE